MTNDQVLAATRALFRKHGVEIDSVAWVSRQTEYEFGSCRKWGQEDDLRKIVELSPVLEITRETPSRIFLGFVAA